MSKIDTNTTLTQVLEDHRLWLNNQGGSRADLQSANLQSADLQKTLFENDIPIIINTEFYNIVKCKDFIKIGCKRYSKEEWANFTDEEINRMDSNALKFWKKYKKFILTDL